ncbi:MAG TPA: peptidoglycan-binding domain-containing protein, partial [Terriglobales bacterium]
MPVLKQGSSGPDVKDLQQKLRDFGFDPNGVDGNFGAGTKAALIAFQQRNGLPADGVAGAATLAALQGTGGATSGDAADEVPENAASASDAAVSPDSICGLNLAALAGKVPDAVI